MRGMTPGQQFGVSGHFTVCCCLCFLLVASASTDMIWGTGSSSYQYEGAVSEGGRGASIWDTFSHTPGKIADNDTGDVAADFYHQYPADIQLMQASGIKHFRFSIAWSRIFPNGTGMVNQKGLDFYRNLTDALTAADITPYVTLYHWDLPQSLQDRYGGFLGMQLVADFAAYARTVVGALADKVEYWTTFNEPQSICLLGYGYGSDAPGRCSDRTTCSEGDSDSEPYICAHTILAAHGAAVKEMRAVAPNAKISINLDSVWTVPYTDSPSDKDAASRRLDFTLGLYADPIYLGDYPQSVKDRVPSLPALTEQEKASLKGSADYFALNHYTTYYVTATLTVINSSGAVDNTAAQYSEQDCASTFLSFDGVPIGEAADSSWLYVVPWGFRELLKYVDQRYGHPDIIVTENGVDVPGEASLPLPDVVHDAFRINYMQTYLDQAKEAKQAGVKLLGYFYWSLLDNFEWAKGFTQTFGMVHVDFSSDARTRTPKDSLAWFANYIA